jgi:Flp pilus assembly pilin Flp
MSELVTTMYAEIRRVATILKDENGADFTESALAVSLIALGAITVADGLAAKIVLGFSGLHDILMGLVGGGSSSVIGG